MAIEFNHTIVSARDSEASAKFLAEMLGLPVPREWGPFQMVTAENGVNIDFMVADGEIKPQHYAFLVSEPEFDEIFSRIRDGLFPTGWIPRRSNPVRLIITMAGAASISRIPMVTYWR